MSEHTVSDSWVEESKASNKKLYSELGVLLRGLERFFYAENTQAQNDDLVSKNYFIELGAARNVVLRVLGILEVVIPESTKNAFWFQKYAGAKYMNTSTRDNMRDDLYKQDSPEKSLLILYDSMINIKGIIAELTKNNFIPYLSFMNVGQLVSRSVRDNTSFNPFKKDIDPEFDVIIKKEISDIVHGISDKTSKRIVSSIFLHLFKFMRYLSHVDITTHRTVSLYCSIIILLLLKSEIDIFIKQAEKSASSLKDKHLADIMDSLSFQFAMETRRVYLQELRDVFSEASPHRLRGRIENAHGILRNLSEQCAIQLAQHWKNDIAGSDIFDSHITKLEQSLRLREDIYVMHNLVTALENTVNSDVEERMKAFNALQHFMSYFESFTFKLLRYNDFEEFSGFFARFTNLKKGGARGKGFASVLELCSHFKIFLETCLGAIQNRVELKTIALDRTRIDAVVNQFTEKGAETVKKNKRSKKS